MMIPAHALAGMTCIHLGLLFSRESKHWLWIGIVMAFFSHAIIDTLAIFTYHEGNPSGTMYSQFVFWFWMIGAIAIIFWGLRTDRRYGYGILAALSFDIWDHWILRTIACAPKGFPDGCMEVYAFESIHLHHFEWLILDTLFANVERHYGDEAYFLVEILSVSILLGLLWWLRKRAPLPEN
jgi:hypothetical protein